MDTDHTFFGLSCHEKYVETSIDLKRVISRVLKHQLYLFGGGSVKMCSVLWVCGNWPQEFVD